MKIEDKTKMETMLFVDIDDGDVFSDALPLHYYLKINKGMWDGEEFNAIRLDNGNLTHFYENETVLKLNARVVIE